MPNEDPDGDGVAFDFPMRFPGQYFDRETNLAYNYFRDYSPDVGRYVESDPIGLDGGLNTYGYVGSSPMAWIDPDGLDRWGAENAPAIVYTNMAAGTTMFYDPFTGQSFTIETKTQVTSNSQLGAGDPYSGLVTICERGSLGPQFGTAKMRTTDPRFRWVHGGGSGLPDPYAPRQGWRKTRGCTRAQNEDIESLCDQINEFRRTFPNRSIIYRRDR
jgi:RHS repeat-associated protein